MENNIHIRPAAGNDFSQLAALLQKENLPVEDLNPQLPHFLVVEEEGSVTAALGLEIYSGNALLRSVIVHPGKRSQGLASKLLAAITAYATTQSVRHLYLITATAETYFQQKGFTKISRADVPEAVLQSKEFNGLCPSTAVIMHRPV